MKSPAHFPLATDKARYVGDAVAVVVAAVGHRGQGRRSSAVVVDYEVLPAVVDLEDALSDRVVIHDDLGTNARLHLGAQARRGRVDAAFAAAAHVVKERYIQQRLIPSAMEPRGVLVPYRPPSAATTPSTPPPRSPTSSR